MEIFFLLLKMIWLMLPAYLSNPAATLSVIFGKPGCPIDKGKYFRSKRIFGDGKTYKGFFSGILFGIFVAIIETFISINFMNGFLPKFNIISIIMLPTGAMAGDLIASFFKRRLGLKRGQAFPIIDQLDFVFGAWIFTIIFSPEWFKQNFTLEIIILTLIFTPVLHILVNIVGYKIGVKKEPW